MLQESLALEQAIGRMTSQHEHLVTGLPFLIGKINF
jgi:hypothetical protein